MSELTQGFAPGPIRINPGEIVKGDEENPEVIKYTRENGETYLMRIVNPERSKPLPTFVFWDETVTPRQQAVIREAFDELTHFLGNKLGPVEYLQNWREQNFTNPDGTLIPFKSIQWQIDNFIDRGRGQVNAELAASQMYVDPNQTTTPHWEAIFTNKDLYTPETRFVIGVAHQDLGTIMSLSRLETISDVGLRGETQKTEIFHEFGHVLCLPTGRRGVNNLEESLGYHCLSKGCSMKQGLSVPDDWIKFTFARLKQGGEPFCTECKTDLEVKFARKQN